MKRMYNFSIILLTMFFLAAYSYADEKKIVLKPGKDTPKAEGKVEITIDAMGQKKVHLTVEYLRPNEVYTVWLVNEKPKMDMAGLGTGGYSFKTDGEGEGHYFATISADELAKWQIIKIAFHPDGDAKNMKGIKIDLEGMLK